MKFPCRYHQIPCENPGFCLETPFSLWEDSQEVRGKEIPKPPIKGPEVSGKFQGNSAWKAIGSFPFGNF